MTSHRKIARQRSYSNRHSATHFGVLGDPDRIDEEGVIGELAFADEFQIPHDQIKRKRPTAYNFKLNSGERVDVRTSRYQHARLIVPPRVAKRKTIDVYVLVEISKSGNGLIRGWATASDVRKAPIRKISSLPGAERVHVLYQHELRDIELLKIRHLPRTLSMF